MTERYALRLTKAAEKELYDLQAKQFKQVAKKIFSLQASFAELLNRVESNGERIAIAREGQIVD